MIFLLLEWRVKMASSKMSSKGQVTIPQEVRQWLGLRPGDRVDFLKEGERTIIRPLREQTHSFKEFVGALPYFKSREEINAWVRDLRDDDDQRAE
jgi:antitoxin PrlF